MTATSGRTWNRRFSFVRAVCRCDATQRHPEVLAWEGEHDGERAVFIGAASAAVLVATSAQQPSISADGVFIAFVRVEQRGVDGADYVVWRKNLGSGVETEVARSGNELVHPSPSNGGDKVAYLEHGPTADRVAVRDMSAGTSVVVRSVEKTDPGAKVVDHPYLTADGQFVVLVEVETDASGVARSFSFGIRNVFRSTGVTVASAVAPATLRAGSWILDDTFEP
jgi:hypothetical protein